MDQKPGKAPGGDVVLRTAWPIGQRALDALFDLGLGEDDLARYFRVSRHEIGAARARATLSRDLD